MKKRRNYYLNDFPTFIRRIGSKISQNDKLAFCYTCIITFICHITFFVERWLNEDDFRYIFGEPTNIGSGRWMNGNILGSKYLLPIVLLVITMIALGLSSALINSMFKIKDKFFVFLISALLATFPILALGFGYSFMIERYVLGILTATFSVYITDKYKYGFIFGAFVLAISLGYYQSYLSIAITLSIFLILIKGFDDIKIKKYIEYILRFLIMGILGIILYLIMVKISCYITGMQLYNYKGINKIGTLPPLSKIPWLIIRTYGHFIGFLFGKFFIKPLNYGLCAQLILSIVDCILVLILIIKSKIYQNKYKFALILFFIIILPLGFNIIDFIAYESNISSLNIYQFVFVFILPLILMNCLYNANEQQNKLITSFSMTVLSWVTCISAIMLIWHNFVITNIYYLKINHFYTYTVELTNRIYDRIESIEGFNSETKVLLGNLNGIYNGLRTNNTFDEIFLYDQGLWHQFIGYYPVPIQSDFKFHMLVSNIIGINLKSVSTEEYEKIINSQEYQEMKNWPHKDSIKFIDDILVIKIS